MLTVHCPGCSLCVRALPAALADDPLCPGCGAVLVAAPAPPELPLALPAEPESAEDPDAAEPGALSFVEQRRLRHRRKIARRLILKVVLVALLGVAAAFAVRAAINRVNEMEAKKGA